MFLRNPRTGVLISRWGSLGDLAAASFLLAALSGAAVAVPYNMADGYGSIATMLLANPSAAFFRNMHYWSGQFSFVLALLHLWEHLNARTERGVSRGVWLRLALTLPIFIFLMLSGFILRGDVDARQALRIVTEATTQVSFVGRSLATFLFGVGGRLEVIYIQHAATATILVWLFIIEHVRRVWPRASSFLAVTLITIAVSLVVSPGLHDGLDPIVKGPWYFLGLQEILHWTPWPMAIVFAGVAFVAALFGLRGLPPAAASWMKRFLLASAVIYLMLCGIGAFLRGENWRWTTTRPVGAGNLRVGWVFRKGPEAPFPLPVVMGRPEGCLVCHQGVAGLGNAHRPEAIGCASCHGGDSLTLDKASAHAGMESVPGNLATATQRCGQAACHGSIIPRIDRSVMTTMRGVVEIDRRVFGEPPMVGATTPGHVKQLGHSNADTHLRQLCAACHLGAPKTDLGPIEEGDLGGGCNACHLAYSPAALDALRTYARQKSGGNAVPPKIHPALSLDIDNGKCFSCHSRSGRISTNYEGWQEVHDPTPEARQSGWLAGSSFRTLRDDRVFERVAQDIHHLRGLDCIDCHTSTEVMGDGVAHARKSGQVRIHCEDCHAPFGTTLPTLQASRIDPEARRILALRALPGPPPKRFIMAANGDALVNGIIDERTGKPVMLRKRNGQPRELKPAARVCTEGAGHIRLSCGSCHTGWASRCNSCHTAFDDQAEAYDWIADTDVVGGWKEKSGPFVADLPTLGIREVSTKTGGRRSVIETFVPGMILSVDRPGKHGTPGNRLSHRLYARVEPHTTQQKSRSCKSCHNDPVAIGYGRGDLRYIRTPRGGRWKFTPAAPPLPSDGLPSDAWIPFLGTPNGMISTRDDVRPFTIEEQRRILQVGACLTCHEAFSPALRGSVHDFKSLLARRSPLCLRPVWE